MPCLPVQQGLDADMWTVGRNHSKSIGRYTPLDQMRSCRNEGGGDDGDDGNDTQTMNAAQCYAG